MNKIETKRNVEIDCGSKIKREERNDYSVVLHCVAENSLSISTVVCYAALVVMLLLLLSSSLSSLL